MKKLIIIAVMTAYTSIVNAQNYNFFVDPKSPCLDCDIKAATTNQNGATVQANIEVQKQQLAIEWEKLKLAQRAQSESEKNGKNNRFNNTVSTIAGAFVGLIQVYQNGQMIDIYRDVTRANIDYLQALGYQVRVQTRQGQWQWWNQNQNQRQNPYLVPGQNKIPDMTEQYANTQNYSGNQQFAKDQYGIIYILENGQWIPYQQNANNTNFTGSNNGIGTLSGNSTIGDNTNRYGNNVNVINQGLGQYQYNTNGTGSTSTFVMPGGNQVNNNGMVWNAATGSFVAANGGFSN